MQYVQLQALDWLVYERVVSNVDMKAAPGRPTTINRLAFAIQSMNQRRRCTQARNTAAQCLLETSQITDDNVYGYALLNPESEEIYTAKSWPAITTVRLALTRSLHLRDYCGCAVRWRDKVSNRAISCDSEEDTAFGKSPRLTHRY